jgi:hypothetical protein
LSVSEPPPELETTREDIAFEHFAAGRDFEVEVIDEGWIRTGETRSVEPDQSHPQGVLALATLAPVDHALPVVVSTTSWS